MKAAQNYRLPILGNNEFLMFDGESVLYTLYPCVRHGEEDTATIGSGFVFEFEISFDDRPPAKIKVVGTLTNFIDMTLFRRGVLTQDVEAFISILLRWNEEMNIKKEILMIKNAVFDRRQILPSVYKSINIELGRKYSIKPLELFDGSLFGVNMHLVSSLFYKKDLPIVDYLADIVPNVLRDYRFDHRQLQSALKGLICLRTHLRGKKLKIEKLTQEPLGNLTFEMDGTRVRVVDYFAKTYNIFLKYPHLPAILIKTKHGEGYVPLEVCIIAEGSRVTTPDSRLQADLVKKLAMKPMARLSELEKASHAAQLDKNPPCKALGIEIDTRFAEVPARTLDAPTVYYAHEQSIVPRSGSWNMSGKRVWSPTHELDNNFLILNFSQRTRLHNVKEFFTQLAEVARGMGLSLRNEPRHYQEIDTRVSEEDLYKIICGFGESLVRDNVKMIFVILNDKSKEFYQMIKVLFDTRFGIITQCITSMNISKLNDKSLLSNIVLKINSKLNGTNHIASYHRPQEGLLLSNPEPTLLVGIHMLPNVKNQRVTIACIAGAMNLEGTVYAHRVSVVPEIYHIVLNLDDHIFELLKGFYCANKNLKPSRIIIYRSGAPDNQFAEIMAYELSAVRRACSKLPGDYKPRVSYIIVQRNHQTNVFQTNQRETDRSGNPMPGLVLDTGIVSQSANNFFLLSHAGIQGTSTMIRYNILFNDQCFQTMDEVQLFTYTLCLLYQRCTRSVSYPAPIFVAMTAGERTKIFFDSFARNGGLDLVNDMDKDLTTTTTISLDVVERLSAAITPKTNGIDNYMYFM
jgi:eukaryotic translation initiation factor 2C